MPPGLGGYDYMLKFLTRSIQHYQEIIEGLLARNIGSRNTSPTWSSNPSS
jgi:hypothetical protein